jgi:hypothetical protein
MGNLIMIAGGTASGVVSAYVVQSAGLKSRLFRVRGRQDNAGVTELPSATTIDIQRFEQEVRADLGVAAAAALEKPRSEWVCKLVVQHIAGGG